MGRTREKERNVTGKVTFLKGGRTEDFNVQITSLVQLRKYQTEWFKIPLQEDAETALRLASKSWRGLTLVTPFWGCCFF